LLTRLNLLIRLTDRIFPIHVGLKRVSEQLVHSISKPRSPPVLLTLQRRIFITAPNQTTPLYQRKRNMLFHIEKGGGHSTIIRPGSSYGGKLRLCVHPEDDQFVAFDGLVRARQPLTRKTSGHPATLDLPCVADVRPGRDGKKRATCRTNAFQL
jgi:hypothetical protein